MDDIGQSLFTAYLLKLHLQPEVVVPQKNVGIFLLVQKHYLRHSAITTMWLTNLFKKPENSPAEAGGYIPLESKLLEQCLEFIPGHFRNTQDFANAVEFVSHRQYAEAVKCLLSLADKPNFYFNNDYWLELAQVASRLNLKAELELCNQKLEANNVHNIVLYKGIVIERISEDTYKHYVSDSLSNEKNEERRQRDGLKEMLAANGFYQRSYGKEGTIYYINGKRVCEIRYQQVTGTHIVVYTYSYEYLALPIRQRLSDGDKDLLRKELTDWLKANGTTVEYE